MRTIESLIRLFCYICVIVIALITIANYYWHPNSKTSAFESRVGKKLDLPGTWPSLKSPTLILALDSKCKFCQSNMRMYESLVEMFRLDTNHPRSVWIVMPNSEMESRDFLSPVLLERTELLTATNIQLLGVRGTPTILALSSNGRITGEWLGYTPEAEWEQLFAQIIDATKR